MSTSGDDIQLVTFKVGGQDFAFNIFQVERILRYEAPSPLPKAPEYLEGVLQYQESAIPLIDMRKRLGVAAPLRDDTRTVILEFDSGKIGLIVDAVTEVLQVAAATVTPPPRSSTSTTVRPTSVGAARPPRNAPRWIRGTSRPRSCVRPRTAGSERGTSSTRPASATSRTRPTGSPYARPSARTSR